MWHGRVQLMAMIGQLNNDDDCGLLNLGRAEHNCGQNLEEKLATLRHLPTVEREHMKRKGKKTAEMN